MIIFQSVIFFFQPNSLILKIWDDIAFFGKRGCYHDSLYLHFHHPLPVSDLFLPSSLSVSPSGGPENLVSSFLHPLLATIHFRDLPPWAPSPSSPDPLTNPTPVTAWFSFPHFPFYIRGEAKEGPREWVAAWSRTSIGREETIHFYFTAICSR